MEKFATTLVRWLVWEWNRCSRYERYLLFSSLRSDLIESWCLRINHLNFVLSTMSIHYSYLFFLYNERTPTRSFTNYSSEKWWMTYPTCVLQFFIINRKATFIFYKKFYRNTIFVSIDLQWVLKCLCIFIYIYLYIYCILLCTTFVC